MIDATEPARTHACLCVCLILTVPVWKKERKEGREYRRTGGRMPASDTINVCLQDLTNLL